MPGVCEIPGVNLVCDGVGDAVAGAAGNFIDQAAKSAAEGVGKLTSIFLTFWTNVNIPGNLDASDGPVAFLRNSTSWIAAFVLIIGLMVAGAKMAITQKAEAGIDAAKGIWQMVLWAGAGLPAILILGHFGDQFSNWIIDRSTGGDFGGRIGAIYGFAALQPLGSFLIVVLAIFAMLSGIGQMALMIVRVGMVAALAGLLPTAASAAVAKGGKAWFSKILAWLIAWLLYKPAAAIVYATAFALVGKGDDIVKVLSGLFLITLSILALPALLRLMVPATAAMVEGSGGAGAAAGIAAGGAVATGALQMRNMKSNSSSTSTSSTSRRSNGNPTGSDSTGGMKRSTPGQTGGTSSPVGATAKTAGGPAGGGAATAHPVGAAAVAGTQAVASGMQAVRGLGDKAAGPTGADPKGGERS